MNQRGFSIVEVVLVLAVVVVLAGLGFVAYNNFAVPKTDSNKPSQDSSQSHGHDMNDMSEVNSTKDLDQAASSLDDTSFDNDGQSEIDSEASKF